MSISVQDVDEANIMFEGNGRRTATRWTGYGGTSVREAVQAVEE